MNILPSILVYLFAYEVARTKVIEFYLTFIQSFKLPILQEKMFCGCYMNIHT